MSKLMFTMEQQQAIEAREKEILVAAAAGSGKTAVLVERIVMLVLTERIDITKLVVLTFTNAAATQMKRRIRERMQILMEQVGADEKAFLEKQVLLLPVAHISTFHAYCIHILRNYYQYADLSPRFKIIEENALTLLKEEALRQTIEQMLEMQMNYHHVLEYFVIGNKLQRLEDTITEIYEKTRSYAFIDTWMHHAIGFTKDEGMIAQLIDACERAYYQQLNIWLRQFNKMEHALVDFPQNQAVIVQLIVSLKQFSMIPYESSIMQLRLLEFPKWPAIKKTEATPESIKAHETFNKLKKAIAQYAEQNTTPEEITNEQRALEPIVSGLLEVVRMYERNLTQLKRAKDYVDFSDVEHKMVELLNENEAVRFELSQNIAEILVDEYQDTNEMQDTILQLLKSKTNRLFMVGDIKQSIYRFRLADPSIFLAKKRQYQEAQTSNEKRLIILNKNFRSSDNILTTVNTVFTSLFKLDVHYPAEEQLYLGTTSEKTHSSQYTKWHFFNDRPEHDTGQIQTIEEKKATAIVNEIVRLTNEGELWDEGANTYRPVKLADIGVLFRARSSQMITYMKQKLEEAQVQYTFANDKGYFDAVEINVVLSCLRVLENPYNTIAFLAYLRSPMCNVTDEELTILAEYYRAAARAHSDKFYLYVTYYIADHKDELALRLTEILQQLADFQQKLTVMRLSQVIELIYQETHYYNFIGTLPNGHLRQLNLDILVKLARKHEARGQNSLLAFNKYMRYVQENKADFAVAKTKGKKDDTLSMMTIHEAKGLEFPIVLFVDLDKQFNEQDVRTPYQLSKKYGLALQYQDIEQQIRYKTQHYQFIARRTEFDSKAEELRVLYVALTRPKQQLHLFLDETEDVKQIETTADILQLRSYGEALRAVYHRAQGESSKWEREDISLKKTIKSKQMVQHDPLDASKGTASSHLTQATIQDINKKMRSSYKYANFENYRQKHTVSELKDRLVMREASLTMYSDELAEKPRPLTKQIYDEKPQFMQRDGLSAKERGTLYHFILEYYPWDDMPTVQAHLKNMMQQSLITESDTKLIQPEKLYKMVRELHEDYLVHGYEIVAKELPFAFSQTAKDIYDESLFSDEKILIQGKIDMLLRKNDTFVVIDFKTDTLRENETIALLNERYENQLFFYREAIRKAYQTENVTTKIYAIFG